MVIDLELSGSMATRTHQTPHTSLLWTKVVTTGARAIYHK